MGYTHYFHFEKKIEEFDSDMLKDIKKVVKKFRDILQYECDDSRPPEVTPQLIHFNGIGGDGHETFYLTPDTTGFNFSKTAEKPYDLPVCMVLLILKHFYGGNFILESDGNITGNDPEENWGAAYRRVKGMGYNLDHEQLHLKLVK